MIFTATMPHQIKIFNRNIRYKMTNHILLVLDGTEKMNELLLFNDIKEIDIKKTE